MEDKRPSNIVAKGFSLDLESTIRDIFNCERFGIGGLADSDFINSSPYVCIVATLMYLYKDSDMVTKGKIERFIEKYSYYSNHSIEEIIVKVNEKEFEDIISDFEKIVN